MPRPRTAARSVLIGVAGWVGVWGGLRAVVLHPEQCGAPTTQSVRASAQAAVDWLASNQRADGTYLYRFDRPSATDLGEYNSVRHAGVVMSLEQAATAGLDGAAESAAAGIDWALDRLHRHEDVVGYQGLSAGPSSGGTALLAAALVEHRRAGDTGHDGVLRGLGRFLVAMTSPSGFVEGQWDLDTEAPVPGSGNKFYTGETFWALALLHAEFPDDGFGDVAERIGRYLPERDDIEGNWPDVTDHWAAYGFAAMSDWPDPPHLSDEQVDYIRSQVGAQSLALRYESQRTNSTWSYWTRGRQTLGAGLGTVGEALAQWWVAVQADPRLDDVAEPLGDRVACAAGVLSDRQVAEDDLTAAERAMTPSPVRGAWFQFGVTQMDDQQHALSALLGALPALDAAGADR